MQAIADLVKEFLIPGSIWFLLVSLTAGLLLSAGPGRVRRWGLQWLAALCVLYWILSLPWIALKLAGGWSPMPTSAEREERLRGVSAIVALGSGVQSYKVGDMEVDVLNEQSAYVVMESVKLYRQLGQPLIIASGGTQRPGYFTGTEGQALSDALVDQQIPRDRIIIEQSSRTTREQAVNVAPLLKSRGVERFALVTSPAHLPRAMAVFEAEALSPVPIPAPFASDDLRVLYAPWQPTGAALVVSQRAIYDHMALVYYWARSWSSAR